VVGAVQSIASGYNLNIIAGDISRGSFNIISEPNSDGLYSDEVTIEATPTPGHELLYWVVNGVNIGNEDPLELTLTGHTSILAVFRAVFIVDNFSDASGSANVPGTLRHAMENARADYRTYKQTAYKKRYYH
jgi:hypothetical protein